MASFKGAGQRLVGNDGKVVGVAFDTEVTGDASTPVPAGRHIVTALDASTGFPASAESGAEDIKVGYMFDVQAGDTSIVPAVGDKYVPLLETDLCDISAWQLQFSADEIQVDTFCDINKVYEIGKVDVAGSVSGIVKVGTTDGVGDYGIARRFMNIVRQSGGDDINLFEKVAGEILVQLYLNKDTDKADLIMFFAPINLFGFSIGAQNGANAQAFESSIRIGTMVAGAAEVELVPALYRIARGA